MDYLLDTLDRNEVPMKVILGMRVSPQISDLKTVRQKNHFILDTAALSNLL